MASAQPDAVDWQHEAVAVSADAQHPAATEAPFETDAAQQHGGCSIGQMHNASIASNAGARSAVWVHAVGFMSSFLRNQAAMGRGEFSKNAAVAVLPGVNARFRNGENVAESAIF
ncbi:hypothetical protein [Rhodopirellula islandica]|uniref:hypothetical protein n=1 Tax=Rhodopirellula islandica TaxID=595434 RepID=UPI00123750D2|nr:hypothetical protein [Rhodopirellula islandica]